MARVKRRAEQRTRNVPNERADIPINEQGDYTRNKADSKIKNAATVVLQDAERIKLSTDKKTQVEFPMVYWLLW